MTQRVFLISRYEGFKKKRHWFHFIGFYRGRLIKKITVLNGEYEKDEDYVLALNVIELEGSYLVGEMIKSKKLFI